MFETEFHLETLLILPLLGLCQIACEDEQCGEVHGVGLEIGWLFWTVRIGYLWK